MERFFNTKGPCMADARMRTRCWSLVALALASACSLNSPGEGGVEDAAAIADLAPTMEKRCGPGPGAYTEVYTSEDIKKFAGCTVFVGRLQEDSVRDLQNFGGLEDLRRIEGTLNVFRSPGFVTLQGLDNLETIDGNLYIHLNPNLRTIAALGRLRLITGDLYISNNTTLPFEEATALAVRVMVRGQKIIRPGS